MALSVTLMQELCKRLKPGARIASFGYPDIIAKPEEVEDVLGERIKDLKYRDDSGIISKWHNIDQMIPDAKSFFGLLGAKIDIYDIAEHRGGEILVDLNERFVDRAAWPFGTLDGYDFVLDVGTMEHCFNIGQAAKNMAGMLKKGGIILHQNPFSQGNHGFYSINPTWYSDFYGQAGFKLHECWLMPKGKDTIKDIDRGMRFIYTGPEANCVAIAERTEVLLIGWPVQWKYKKMIAAAGLAGEKPREAANG
jgi:hypothetical protein